MRQANPPALSIAGKLLEPRRIVVPTDFSELAKRALPFAANLARHFKAQVVLIHALPQLPEIASGSTVSISDYREALFEQAKVELDGLSRGALFADLKVRTWVSLDDLPAPATVEAVNGHRASLVIISSHGRRGASRVLLGSVAEEIARTSPVPVLTVTDRAELWQGNQPILVPVDFSPASLYAVEAAARMSTLLSLPVRLAHVIEPPQSPAIVAALPEVSEAPRADLEIAARKKLGDLAAATGLTGRYHADITFGGPKERIVRMAQDHDPALIVLGSHGRRGLGRVVLGSVAEGVVRESQWPTLLVKDGRFLERWPGPTSSSRRTPGTAQGATC